MEVPYLSKKTSFLRKNQKIFAFFHFFFQKRKKVANFFELKVYVGGLAKSCLGGGSLGHKHSERDMAFFLHRFPEFARQLGITTAPFFESSY